MNPEQPQANAEQTAAAAEQASRCRRLASATYDRRTAQMLEQMAADYEQRASNNDL